MEFKHFHLHDVKADEATRTIEGWASTFGNIDSDNDIIIPGAFIKSLQKNGLPKMLWQHRTELPIGVWESAEETAQGLRIKGRILDTTLGEDVYKLTKAGAIDSMSIGYKATEYDIDKKTGTRRLKEVELYEVSLVTFPANEEARITSVKNKPDTERDLERLLRDAGGYSHREAKAIVAEGFKGIAGQRDVEQQVLPQLAGSLDRLLSSFKQIKL